MTSERKQVGAEATDARRQPEAVSPQPVTGVVRSSGRTGAVNGRASGPLLQAKLEVGPAGDRYEQEADRVAAAVMRDIRSTKVAPKGDGNASGLPDQAGSPPIRRFALSDDVRPRSAGSDIGPATGVSRIQLKTAAPTIGAEGGAVDADTDSKIRQATGGGEPLDEGLRRSMEGGFGADFSGVRVHNDSTANELNQRIQAKAFTTGSDVFFRSGEYNPSTTAGQELVAHELTHVVQQGGAGVRRSSDTIQREGDGEGAAPTKKESTKTFGKQATEKKSDVFDGTTETKSSSSSLVGAGASLKRIEEASESEIKDAVEFLARAGAFGAAERSAAYERGGLALEASGKAEGFAGAEVNLKAGLTVSDDLMNAITATFEVAAKLGVGADLSAAVKATYGSVSAELEAKLSVFAGLKAAASGEFHLGLAKTGIAGSASASAGAKAEGSATAKLTVGGAELQGEANASAFAGAEAAAKGEFTIGLSGVTIEGSAEAFAGVKAEAGAKAGLSLRGMQIFSVEAKVEVSAGVGGKVSGGFSVSGGKIKISGGLAATLGIGGGASVAVELDVYALVSVLERMVIDAFMKKSEEVKAIHPGDRVPCLDQRKAVQMHKLGYETMLPDLNAYKKKKAKQGKKGVKGERVEEIILKRYQDKLKDAAPFLETDEGIMMAIKDVLGVDALVQIGMVRSWSGKWSG